MHGAFRFARSLGVAFNILGSADILDVFGPGARGGEFGLSPRVSL